MSDLSSLLADDLAARRRIQMELETNCFVEAGAGTGKTTALIARLLEIVGSGRAEMGEIAAITFTEAAAADLRQRIRKETIDRIVAQPGNSTLRRGLRSLEEATVTTIHGFAQRILRDYPIEAGLPLRFSVSDDIETGIRTSRRFSESLDRFLGDPAANDLIAAALAIGLRPTQFLALFRSIEGQQSAVEVALQGDWRLASAELGVQISGAVDQILRAADQLLTLRVHCTDGGDTMLARLNELSSTVEDVRAVDDFSHRLELLENAPVLRAANRGRKQSWSQDIDAVRSAVEAYGQFKSATLAQVHDSILRSVIDYFAEDARAAARQRWKEGELNFDDLLVLAHRLLDRNPDVRQEVARRFRYLFVDEFQDTDPLQYEIIRLIATGHNAVLHPGKLFLVGDPKQAIYRFRGADVALYLRARQNLVDDGFIELRASFRSVPGIIDWVNETFSHLLQENDELGRLVEYSGLVPTRGAEKDRHPVVIIGGPEDEVKNVRDRREQSSRDLASCIATAISDDWTVDDGGRSRPLRYGDVAILIPRRTGLESIEDALDEYGVPYTVSSPSLIYASNEVHDLLSCLRAMAYPSEEQAVVAALRSSIFACSDEELVVFRRGGGQWRLGGELTGELRHHRVAQMLGELQKLSARRSDLGVQGVLRALVSERRVRQSATFARRAPEVLRRIDFLLEEARAYVESGGRELIAFLEWTEQRKLERAAAVETQGAARGEDVVQIMTIHGAKGLEFPMVVVGELNVTSQGQTGTHILVGDDYRMELRVRNGIETSGYALLAEKMERFAREELRRLVYVGATRASDFLVFALHHRPAQSKEARTIAEELYLASSAMRSVEQSHNRRSPPVALVRTTSTDELSKTLSDIDETDYQDWVSRRFALASKTFEHRAIRASDLVVAPELPRWKQSVLSNTEREPSDNLITWRSPRAASALGRAVHRVLQEVDFENQDQIEVLARRSAELEQCADNAATVAMYARSALDSPVVRQAHVSKRCWRELPVSYSIEGSILEGVIDLCFVSDEGLVLVDYKTDAITHDRDATNALNRYGVQLGAYALALEGALDLRVTRAVIVFLSPPTGAIEREVVDLEKEKDEALRVVRERIATAVL